MRPDDSVWVVVAPLALTSTLKLLIDEYCKKDTEQASCDMGYMRTMTAKNSRLTLSIMYAMVLLATVVACLVIVPSVAEYPAPSPLAPIQGFSRAAGAPLQQSLELPQRPARELPTTGPISYSIDE